MPRKKPERNKVTPDVLMGELPGQVSRDEMALKVQQRLIGHTNKDELLKFKIAEGKLADVAWDEIIDRLVRRYNQFIDQPQISNRINEQIMKAREMADRRAEFEYAKEQNKEKPCVLLIPTVMDYSQWSELAQQQQDELIEETQKEAIDSIHKREREEQGKREEDAGG